MSKGILKLSKSLGIQHNVSISVIDEPTGDVVCQHIGHNAATNTLLTGIGHFLEGESLNGSNLIADWIPQYISLGTMGLYSQEEDEEGLPTGIGNTGEGTEAERFTTYLAQCPGYGSDGYSSALMNGRSHAGLGPMYPDRTSEGTTDCELISESFPRSIITYRDVVPEYEAEYPKTIDVVYSAIISTGALAQFREPGKDYVFITEAGLWSKKNWIGTGDNGLLAGYRIAPPDKANWDMEVEENRNILKHNIIRVGINQIVQVVWKIQLGAIEQLTGSDTPAENMKWNIVL